MNCLVTRNLFTKYILLNIVCIFCGFCHHNFFLNFFHSVENVPVKEILLELASKINMNQRCRVNINRSAVWEGAVRGFKRLSYEPHLMVSVKFSDDMGESEEGVDLGGPRREFLRLLIESIAKSPMFEGKENSKNLALYSTGTNLLCKL